jgi:hypothetical protein
MVAVTWFLSKDEILRKQKRKKRDFCSRMVGDIETG